MKIKTSELLGPALDWAVAKALGGKASLQPAFGGSLPRVVCVSFTPVKYLSDCFVLDSADYRKVKKEYLHDGGVSSKVPLWRPSTDWSEGGPIIERAGLCITSIWSNAKKTANPYDNWKAHRPYDAGDKHTFGEYICYGHTPLIAAMRCYVLSELGDEIDVPEELL